MASNAPLVFPEIPQTITRKLQEVYNKLGDTPKIFNELMYKFLIGIVVKVKMQQNELKNSVEKKRFIKGTTDTINLLIFGIMHEDPQTVLNNVSNFIKEDLSGNRFYTIFGKPAPDADKYFLDLFEREVGADYRKAISSLGGRRRTSRRHRRRGLKSRRRNRK